MKNYKGLYHDNNIKAPNFEHGAHFKYSDLVEALKKLQADLSKDGPNLEIYNSLNKDSKTLINESPKKHKKIKLKHIKNKENQRYNEINYTERNNDKEIKIENNDILIQYSKDTDKELFKRKRNHKKIKLPKELCKSLDRNESKLPAINSNLNSISLRKNFHKFDETEKVLIVDKINEKFDEDEKILIADKDNKEFEEKEKNIKNEDNNNIINEIISKKRNKSKFNKKHYESEIFLPKIKYNYYNQITIEKEDKDFNNEKIGNKQQNNDNINSTINSPVKKPSHGMFTNILSTDKNENKEDLFQNSEKKILNYKLKSIFETERKIKHHNNHHFSLISRNKIFNMKHMDTASNELSKQIFNLKKNLLSNNIRNPNISE
jgi:hypothetical protein